MAFPTLLEKIVDDEVPELSTLGDDFCNDGDILVGTDRATASALAALLADVRRETVAECVRALRERADYVIKNGHTDTTYLGIRNVALWLENEMAGRFTSAAPKGDE